MSEQLTTIRSRRIVELASVPKIFGENTDEYFPILQQGSTKKVSMGQVETFVKEMDFASWVYGNSAIEMDVTSWVHTNTATELQATSWVQNISDRAETSIETIELSSENWNSVYNLVSSGIVGGALGTLTLGVNAVSSENIRDRVVTPEKLSLGGPWWNNFTKTTLISGTNNFYVRTDPLNNLALNLYLSTFNNNDANIMYPQSGTMRLSTYDGNIEIATRSNGDIIFITNNNIRMTIDGESEGTISINSPTNFSDFVTIQNLDVANLTFQSSSSLNITNIALSTINLQAGSQFIFTDLSGTQTFSLFVTGNNYNEFGIYQGGVARFYIDSIGQVGIGTTNPQVKLDVFGDIRGNKLLLKRLAPDPNDESINNSDSNGARIQMARAYDNKYAYAIEIDGSGSNQSFIIKDILSNPVLEQPRLTISSGGNIGLGVAPNTTNRLNVDGSGRFTGSLESQSVQINNFVSIPNNSSYRIKNSSNQDVNVLNLDTSNNVNLRGTNFYFNNLAGTERARLDSTGTFTAVGDVIAFSDEKLKENISTIQNALEKTNLLNGVEFTRKDSGKKSIGLIAQEVEKIIPEVVSTNENGIKGIAYGNLIGLLVEAIKELTEEVKTLKEQKNVC
jgi:hypothetical protein